MSNTETTKAPEDKKLVTQKDLNKAMFRWYLSAEMPLNFENMQGIAFCGSIAPILKKIYTKKEDLVDALKRHLLLYNCNITAGGLILGTTIAMEEQRSQNPDAMPAEAITGMKTGLMGPVAALGDSFDWGIIGTLFKIAAATLAASGNPLALPVLLIFAAYCIGELILFTNLTYKKGRSSIKSIMGSGLMQDVISGANVLAMFMMGAMTASMVTLTTPLKISSVNIQESLDGIFPGVFPLAALFLIYWLVRKKKVGTGKIVIGVIAVSIIGAAIGIF
ncbi:MAG TPA: PTS system mannose/fructose/sorbose family transporter subunit IID [Candidatus Anaerostipes avistercoris]|uniref:PTS system mannose/fructose/sorbose family transporter subunit IID n=1 Tax=Candidatus Anaerostipes avistercoris TaxID=2838462 RepID=A0A9D2PG21_9FIRM|nr:PTS system mannose/fructose/sorbose family transporter subunit IID [uncultured Anaerostipes sp.]HJC49282.1 PTS system mannose/fructose/sorbose family transporter subunit IID [Candidatus Anaerostipes avistercoris]